MTQDTAIPAGSLVLLTGINSLVGSHVADKLLKHGYRVRGTARSSAKLTSILQTLEDRHPGADVKGIVVGDMSLEGAFLEAVQDCVGVIHVASDVSLHPDPNIVVSNTIKGLENALKAAAAVKTVKRFVYTSSISTLSSFEQDVKMHIDASSWNYEVGAEAWAPPPYEPSRSMAVYVASKVQAEQFAWKYTSENKLNFEFNVVLPAFVLGPILKGANGSSAGYVQGLYEGDQGSTQALQQIGPNWHIDAEDIALLHLAALVDVDVVNERILGMCNRFTYTLIVDALKKADPSKPDYPEPPLHGQNLSTVDLARTVGLLKRYGKREITTLDESISRQLGKGGSV